MKYVHCVYFFKTASKSTSLQEPLLAWSSPVSVFPPAQAGSLILFLLSLLTAAEDQKSVTFGLSGSQTNFQSFFLSPNIVTLRVLSAQDIQKSEIGLKITFSLKY